MKLIVNKCNNKKTYQKKRLLLFLMQLLLLIAIILSWELLSRFEIIDSFIFSKPSDIMKLLLKYINNYEIFSHIKISLLETLLGIIIGSGCGILIAIILWRYSMLQKIIDPFLNVLNALPKTALAPIMIIWAGADIKGIVFVAISILLIITIMSAYNYFILVDKSKIKMLKSFNATKNEILFKLIIPSNARNILNVVKINIGLSWVGVIVGEFLVSKRGIGYLIMYGSQVFDMRLVMMGVLVLAVLAFAMWKILDIIEKKMFTN